MKGLIIKEPWISLILSRKKTRELRSRDTRVRGRIALIRKGSGTVIGVAELVGTLPKLSRQNSFQREEASNSAANCARISNTRLLGFYAVLRAYISGLHIGILVAL
jgi:hypothetical protein